MNVGELNFQWYSVKVGKLMNNYVIALIKQK